jgi:hypothetical protein
VIQGALWDELDDLSEEEKEKMLEILDKWKMGIITFDAKWKFRLDKLFPAPEEEDTGYLLKARRRQKGE